MSIRVYMTEHGMMLNVDDVSCRAGIGKNGLVSSAEKTEGDGKTPMGTWPLRCLYYRADRISVPPCALKTIPITKEMGWCDDPNHADYNTEVSLPFDASHEKMWRDDSAYDVVIPLGYNDDPAERGRGSAIFFHLLHDGKSDTEGCVAVPRHQMLSVIEMISAETTMTIGD